MRQVKIRHDAKEVTMIMIMMNKGELLQLDGGRVWIIERGCFCMG